MEEHKDSPKINRSGRIRQPGPSRQVSSVHATIDADTHGDVLNAHPVSMRAMSACGDVSTVRNSRHDATGSVIVRTGLSSHHVLNDVKLSGNQSMRRAQVRNGSLSSRLSVRSSHHSAVSAVTNKMAEVAINNAINEEEEELEREAELRAIDFDAELLERRAKLMRKRTHLLRQAGQSSGSQCASRGQQVKQEADVEENDSIGEGSLLDTVEDEPIEFETRMCKYVDDCQRVHEARKNPAPKAPELHKIGMEGNQENGMIRAEMARVELPKFDGNTAEYWSFFKQFEIHVESRTSSAQQRMLYLLNYCTGRAKRAINGFALLPAEEGYAKARSALSKRFGRPHVVSQKLIEELLRTPAVRRFDEVGLADLHMKMEECLTTLGQMNYLADLDNINTLQGIVDKLTDELLELWITRTDSIYKEG